MENDREKIKIKFACLGFEFDALVLGSGVNELAIGQDSPFDDQGKLVYDTNLGLHHVAKTFINTQSQGELQIQAGLCIQPLHEYPDIQVREFVFIAARLKSIDLEIYKVHRLGQSSLKFTGDIIVATVHSLILLAGSI